MKRQRKHGEGRGAKEGLTGRMTRAESVGEKEEEGGGIESDGVAVGSEEEEWDKEE